MLMIFIYCLQILLRRFIRVYLNDVFFELVNLKVVVF